MSHASAEMNGSALPAKRRKLLELAPLELECMTTLWVLHGGTVREIRDALAERRPRAYTTIMTIMDRLARKQIVSRQRVGRAWRYEAKLSKEEARARAVAQVVESFFGGSADELLEQLYSMAAAHSAAGGVHDSPASTPTGEHAENRPH